MKTFKQIDEVWEAYCKMTDVEVSDSISISYNPTELDRYKVEISDAKHSIHLSKEEARLLAEKLYYLTFDEEIEEQPEVIKSSSKEWYSNGEVHRTDGPTIEHADGNKEWWVNGKLHRTDGPAIEDASGLKMWYNNGKLHREDGPAIKWANGCKEWWLEGIKMTEEEWKERTGK